MVILDLRASAKWNVQTRKDKFVLWAHQTACISGKNHHLCSWVKWKKKNSWTRENWTREKQRNRLSADFFGKLVLCIPIINRLTKVLQTKSVLLVHWKQIPSTSHHQYILQDWVLKNTMPSPTPESLQNSVLPLEVCCLTSDLRMILQALNSRTQSPLAHHCRPRGCSMSFRGSREFSIGRNSKRNKDCYKIFWSQIIQCHDI